jgi:uncharacterized protein (TIGR02597 family)
MTTLRNTCFALLFAGSAALPASAVTLSQPVGALQLLLRGNSDTMVSLPLLRPALVTAAIAVQTGSQFALTSTIPALPAEGAFVLVMTGSLEGAILPITIASGTAVAFSAGAYNLASLKTETVNGTGHGDLVAIVPYWTLDTVFPLGAGLNVSTDPVTHTSEVLLYDDGVPGTQFSPSTTYYYYAGGTGQPAGWYLTGGGTTPKGTTRLAPQQYFVVRNNMAGDTHLMVCGGVQMAGYSVPLAVLQSNTNQDNLVSLPLPLPTTLGGCGLFQSGAFVASANGIVLADEVLVYNNATVAHQKAPSATFFYLSGTSSKPAGWYQVGNTATNSNGFVLNPGEGLIVRKQGNSSPFVDLWSAVPPYLQ